MNKQLRAIFLLALILILVVWLIGKDIQEQNPARTTAPKELIDPWNAGRR